MVLVVVYQDYLKSKEKNLEEPILDSENRVSSERDVKSEQNLDNDGAPVKKKSLARWKKAGIYAIQKSESDNPGKNSGARSFLKFRLAARLMMIKMQIRKEKEETSFTDLSILEKIEFILDFPLVWLRKLTILPCESDKYDKRLTYVWPVFGTLILLYGVLKTPSMLWVYIGVPFGIISFIFLYVTQRNNKINEIPKYFLLIAIVGKFY